jgi:transposase
MVIVGVDVHKRTHTLVAVNEVGRKLGEKVVKAAAVGHAEAVMWAREQFGAELVWGVEDCRHVSVRLERDLLTAGQQVVRVPTRLMAQTRSSARTAGKSDPIDALMVARAVLREPDLPVATHDEVSRELKLLVDRRDTLVAQRTATINTLRWRIHELDVSRASKPAALDRPTHQRALAVWLDAMPGLLAELARAELDDIVRLTEQINALGKRIGDRVREVAPSLLAIPGCGELSAAKIVGEAAGVGRFKSEAAFARHAGVAPIPVWSGNNHGRMRLCRGGNRQLNTALHRIAITQIRCAGPAQNYYRTLLTRNKTGPEARRCLKRRISHTVFQALKADQQTSQPAAA